VYRGATWEFYQADGLGSITSLSTSIGTITDSFVYDSFGNVTANTGSFAQPFRFTGREWDAEMGLYYYRARYYDFADGRFLSEDPLMFGGSRINLYGYVNNNPTNLVDPLGLFSKPLRWPNAKTRPCNSVEHSRCSQICGSKGVESCRVSQTFRAVRSKEGKILFKWADGPMSCSCREECEKPFRIPLLDPLADWLNDKLGYPFKGPAWDRVRDWQREFERGPQPVSGWGTVPGPIPVPIPVPVIP